MPARSTPASAWPASTTSGPRGSWSASWPASCSWPGVGDFCAHIGRKPRTPPLVGSAQRPPELGEPPGELGLEAAVGRLVEALALHSLRDHLLFSDPAGLVMGIDIAHATPQLAGSVVMSVAQVRGRWLRPVLTHVSDRPL